MTSLIEDLEQSPIISSFDNMGSDFLTAALDGNGCNDDSANFCNSTPYRTNALVMIVVLEGTAKMEVDYMPYLLAANSFMLIMPDHIMQPVSVSRDFKGWMVLASSDFLQSYATERRPSMVYYMQMRKNPHFFLEAEEMTRLNNCFLELQKRIRQRTHLFHREIMQVTFAAFLLDLGHISTGKSYQETRKSSPGKEDLFERFFGLLHKHCRKQHNVTFYANELCVTPQYLSSVLRTISGKPANKWIEDALIVEAKILLKKPGASVQQVSDVLNFSDQSTFGKFFKKKTNTSPSKYRKKEG